MKKTAGMIFVVAFVNAFSTDWTSNPAYPLTPYIGNPTYLVTSEQSYGSEPKSSVNVHIWGPSNASTIIKPIIYVEGFDFYNTDDVDGIMADLSKDAGRDIGLQLIADGYTIFIVDWKSPNASIQSNAFALLSVIKDAWNRSQKVNQMSIIGVSMGGVVTRYALGYAEKNNIQHNCGLYISFDSPHKGANIPLGVQHFADFFAGRNDDAKGFRDIIASDAAEQLMIRNIFDPQGTKRNTLLGEMNINGMPKKSYNVAISNGMINGKTQNIGDNQEALTWDVTDSYGISVGARVYTSPYNNRSGNRAFYGWLDAGWFDVNPQERTVVYSNEPAWDDAPGGYFSAVQLLDEKLKLNIPSQFVSQDLFSTAENILNYPFHCFVPTVSALDLTSYNVLTNNDLYHSFIGADLNHMSTFNEVYYPSYETNNERHGRITAQTASFIRKIVRVHTRNRLVATINSLLLQ